LKSEREIILDRADISMMMPKGPMKPESFDEAFDHSVIDSRTKWENAIDEDFE
jgi:hypothetical protein